MPHPGREHCRDALLTLGALALIGAGFAAERHLQAPPGRSLVLVIENGLQEPLVLCGVDTPAGRWDPGRAATPGTVIDPGSSVEFVLRGDSAGQGAVAALSLSAGSATGADASGYVLYYQLPRQGPVRQRIHPFGTPPGAPPLSSVDAADPDRTVLRLALATADGGRLGS